MIITERQMPFSDSFTLEEDMYRLLALLALVALYAAPGQAQPNIVSSETTCEQLVAAHDVVIRDLRKHNYVEVLAKAFFENNIARRKDGQPTSLEEVREYIREVSKTDALRFVLFAVGDLQSELDEKKCTYHAGTAFKWEAP